MAHLNRCGLVPPPLGVPATRPPGGGPVGLPAGSWGQEPCSFAWSSNRRPGFSRSASFWATSLRRGCNRGGGGGGRRRRAPCPARRVERGALWSARTRSGCSGRSLSCSLTGVRSLAAFLAIKTAVASPAQAWASLRSSGWSTPRGLRIARGPRGWCHRAHRHGLHGSKSGRGGAKANCGQRGAAWARSATFTWTPER